MTRIGRHGLVAALTSVVLLTAAASPARASGSPNLLVFGIQLSLGGRYDDVRLCVASGKDVSGGIAADISFFAEVGVAENISLFFDVPVMRPIIFATAFDMLQFEPFVVLNFRIDGGDTFDFIAGPSLGFSLNYGPDWHSETSGPGRTASFFSFGPRIGGYVGFDFKRPGQLFDFQLGLHPYFTPLWGINDPQSHQGFVVGGLLDGQLRFTTTP
jgi:hypothetical protein